MSEQISSQNRPDEPREPITMAAINSETDAFLERKTAYFSGLALQEKEALRLHRSEGLWQRTEDGDRDWGNVTEHCLVEAARVQIFAQILGFDESLTSDLMTAAALHDYFKKGEKEVLEQKGLSWDAYSEAQEIAKTKLAEAGFNERIINLVGSVGHETSPEAEAIASQDSFSENNLAYLVMHYVDDYTINSDWVNSARGVGSQRENDLDARMDKNEANPRYARFNEEGREHFDGETAYSVQRRVGHLVEDRLADIISRKTGRSINPLDLPEFIDNVLKQRIAS